MVHTWAKDFVNDVRNVVEPVHMYLLGSIEKVKSQLGKVIYNVISKILLYHCKNPKKPTVPLLGSTGVSAINIGGMNIHSGRRIKPETNLHALNGKLKRALRNRISEVKSLVIDELSIALSDFWINVYYSWKENEWSLSYG